MVFLQIAGGETFKRVKEEQINRRGHIDLSVGNHPIALGHKPQLDRLLDILTGITTGDPEKRPKVSDPTLLIWRHQLRKCENGKPVGEPLDLTKSTKELGLKPAEVLYLEYAPEKSKAAPASVPKDGEKNASGAKPAESKPTPKDPADGGKPAPKPADSEKAPKAEKKDPAEGGKKPPPNPTAPEGAKEKKKPPPNPTGAGAGEVAEKPKKPKTSKSEAKDSGAPAAQPTPMPLASAVPPATPASPAAGAAHPQPQPMYAAPPYYPPTPQAGPAQYPATAGQETGYMVQQFHQARHEADALSRGGLADADAWLRRMEMGRTEDSMRRMRDDEEAARHRGRLAEEEERIRRRERDLERQEREMRHREDTLAAERKRALETLASASPRRSAAAPAPAAVPPELLATITSLQSDNRELRDMLRDLKHELATRSTPAPAAPAAPGPSDALPRLGAKVRGILNATGLAHYAEVFREHQMDEAALRHATEDDLADLGLSPDEQVRLLAVLRSGSPVPAAPQSPALPSVGGMPWGEPQQQQQLGVLQPSSPPLSPARFRSPSPRRALPSSDASFHREVLVAFYSRYDPEKVAHVDFLLGDLQGDIEDVYPAIVDAYGLDQSVFTPRVAEALGLGKAGAAPVLAALWRDHEAELLGTLSGRPCEWAELRDTTGRVFYYSNAFNVSQWARPAALAQSDERLAEGQQYASHLRESRAAGVRPQPCSLHSPVFVSEGRQRTPSGSPPRRLQQRDDHYKAWVVAFLLKHAPHRLSDVDRLLRCHSGPELADILMREYGQA